MTLGLTASLVLFSLLTCCLYVAIDALVAFFLRADQIYELLLDGYLYGPPARPIGPAERIPFVGELGFLTIRDGISLTDGVTWRPLSRRHRLIGPSAQATIFAALPRPLGFELEVATRKQRAGAGSGPGIAALDSLVAISTDDDGAARELLGSAMLRSTLRVAIRALGEGNLLISRGGVRLDLADGHDEFYAIHRRECHAVNLARAIARRELIRLGEAAPTLQERMADLLIEGLEEKLTGFVELRMEVAGRVTEGAALWEARGWQKNDAEDAPSRWVTPPGLPRRGLFDAAPRGLVRVNVECALGGGGDFRNTWYNYNGYYLTLLVFERTGEIWDAVWERTDY